MRIGILGGTFNPSHSGHLILAEFAKDYLNLDKIIFMPCNIPPHKKPHLLLKSSHRFNMVKLALRGNRNFSVSREELKRKGPSYTVDTLRIIRKNYPHDKLFLIIGSDLLEDFRKWKNPELLKRLAKIVVVLRNGIRSRSKGCIFVPMPCVNISSSLVRERIKNGQSIKYFVPAQVEAYIKKHRLYR